MSATPFYPWISAGVLAIVGGLLVHAFLGLFAIGALTVGAAATAMVAQRIPNADRRTAIQTLSQWRVVRSVLAHSCTLTGLALCIVTLLVAARGPAAHGMSVLLWTMSALTAAWVWVRRSEKAGSAEPWQGSLALGAGVALLAAGLPTVLFGDSWALLGRSGGEWSLLAYPWWATLVIAGAALGFAFSDAPLREVKRLQAAAAMAPQVEQVGIGEPHGDRGPRPLRPQQDQGQRPNRDLQRGSPAPSPHVAPAALHVPVVRSPSQTLTIEEFPEHVFGQDNAMAEWQALLAAHLPFYRSGVVTRPLSVMHVGPLGCGKHFLAELLANGPLQGLNVQVVEGLDVPANAAMRAELHAAIAEGDVRHRRSVFIACLDDPSGVVADLCADGPVNPSQLIAALGSRVDKQMLASFTRIIPFAPCDATACALIAGRHLETLADRAGLIVTRLDPRFLARCAALATVSVMATGARAIQLAVPRLLGDGLERCRLHRAATIEIAVDDNDAVQFHITSTLA